MSHPLALLQRQGSSIGYINRDIAKIIVSNINSGINSNINRIIFMYINEGVPLSFLRHRTPSNYVHS